MRGSHRRKDKRIWTPIFAVILAAAMMVPLFVRVRASQTPENDGSENSAVADPLYRNLPIEDGITINGQSVAGQTKEEARQFAQGIIDGRKNAVITLNDAMDNATTTVSAGNLGLIWTNEDMIDDIAHYGHGCNIIERYKDSKDLEKNGYDFTIGMDFDKEIISQFIAMNCTAYDVAPVEGTITKENGVFTVNGSAAGHAVNIDTSTEKIYQALMNNWSGQDMTINLNVETKEPKASPETLSHMTSILGSFTTYYATDNVERAANIANGCALINGTTVNPGEEFSVLDTITPFTAENGYELAGSYADNEIVNSFGGGICQVSTTLYNAVIRAELKITERNNHTMIVDYVDPSDDAAIAESAGMDMRFVNNLENPVYIEGITDGGAITFNIYGVETRAPGRVVSFESETLEEIPTEGTEVRTDATQPVGFVTSTPGHTGYKAQLWKVVSKDNLVVSKDIFNHSVYSMTPTIIRVGTAGTVTPELQNAINSKDLAAIQTAAENAKHGAASSEQAQAAAAAADDAYQAALADGQDTAAAADAAQAAAAAAANPDGNAVDGNAPGGNAPGSNALTGSAGTPSADGSALVPGADAQTGDATAAPAEGAAGGDQTAQAGQADAQQAAQQAAAKAASDAYQAAIAAGQDEISALAAATAAGNAAVAQQ